MPDQKQRKTADGRMIPRGRPWRKGESGNPNGRPPQLLKPIPPELLETVRTLTRYVVRHPAYQDNLVERVFLGRAPAMERLIWFHAFGKPIQVTKHEEEVGLDFAACLQKAWEQLQAAGDPRLPKRVHATPPVIDVLPHGTVPTNGRQDGHVYVGLEDQEDDSEELWPGDVS